MLIMENSLQVSKKKYSQLSNSRNNCDNVILCDVIFQVKTIQKEVVYFLFYIRSF